MFGGKDVAQFAELADIASGVMMVSLSADNSSYILWFRKEIIQAKKGNVFMFSLAIGGKTLWSVENSDPREFSDVKVYASSGWYEAQAGYIRGFLIENMAPGENNIGLNSEI